MAAACPSAAGPCGVRCMVGVAVYLAGRVGSYVTGAMIPVDGGIRHHLRRLKAGLLALPQETFV